MKYLDNPRNLPPFQRGAKTEDPSTQPGTPQWTHHLVTRSKQRIGVEATRNFIPTPSTLFVLSVFRFAFTNHESLGHESRFPVLASHIL